MEKFSLARFVKKSKKRWAFLLEDKKKVFSDAFGTSDDNWERFGVWHFLGI
jgi:hypothetical protein